MTEEKKKNDFISHENTSFCKKFKKIIMIEKKNCHVSFCIQIHRREAPDPDRPAKERGER